MTFEQVVDYTVRTYEEALKFISENVVAYDSDMAKCIEIYKKALEKQIPKKPIIKVPENDDVDDYWKCPNCGTIESTVNYGGYMNYCPTCGQAIDWSEEKLWITKSLKK